MKKVIFDVDGVLLSEERYYDVSALTVWRSCTAASIWGCRRNGRISMHQP